MAMGPVTKNVCAGESQQQYTWPTDVGEMIAVYSENHMEHINTTEIKIRKLFNGKADGIYSSHRT
jgi:hypothetical protein